MTINLLLIDDRSVEAQGIRSTLETVSPEFNLLYARNEESALQQLAENPDVQIVYCDTRMYREDLGPEIAKKIKEKYPDLRIIGISSDFTKVKLWQTEFEFMQKRFISRNYFVQLYVSNL